MSSSDVDGVDGADHDILLAPLSPHQPTDDPQLAPQPHSLYSFISAFLPRLKVYNSYGVAVFCYVLTFLVAHYIFIYAVSTTVSRRVMNAWSMCAGILLTICMLLLLKEDVFQNKCHSCRILTVLAIFPFGIGAMVLAAIYLGDGFQGVWYYEHLPTSTGISVVTLFNATDVYASPIRAFQTIDGVYARENAMVLLQNVTEYDTNNIQKSSFTYWYFAPIILENHPSNCVNHPTIPDGTNQCTLFVVDSDSQLESPVQPRSLQQVFNNFTFDHLLVKIDCWRDDDCVGYKNAYEIAAKQNNFRQTDGGRGQVTFVRDEDPIITSLPWVRMRNTALPIGIGLGILGALMVAWDTRNMDAQVDSAKHRS